MYSTSLLKFAGMQKWQTAKDEDLVYGVFQNRLFTAMSERHFTAFMTPLAGVSPGSLARLTAWLEQTRSTFRLRNYDISDNFLCVRLQERLIRRTPASFKIYLSELVNTLDQYNIPASACVICGENALQDDFLEGLFCKMHPECRQNTMKNFTDCYDHADTKPSLEQVKISEAVTNLAASFAPYREDMLQDLIALCKIRSVKGEATPDAPFGKETVTALAKFEEIAVKLGFSFTNLDNYCGFAEIGTGKEMVAAVCHLDVMPAGDGWDHDPFTPVVAGDEIIGRGTSDDKGPAIATLYAAKALLDDGFVPNKRIRIIVGLDEESGSACMAHYNKVAEIPVAGFTADADFPVIYAEKGLLRVFVHGKRSIDTAKSCLINMSGGEAINIVPALTSFTLQCEGKTESLQTQGVPAHASIPDKGSNSIALAVQKIHEQLTQLNSSDPFIEMFIDVFSTETNGQSAGIACNDETGSLTLNVATINLTENEFSLGLDIRVPVSVSLDSVYSKLQERIAAYDYDLELNAKSPALDSGINSPLVTKLMEVYNTMMDQEATPVAIGGGTYARSLPNIVAFGHAFPGDEECAHQANEFVSMPKLLAAAAIYKEALRILATES